MTYKNLPQHNLTAQLYLKFLLITENKVAVMIMHTSKAKKKIKGNYEEGVDISNQFIIDNF